jgi:DNA-directed RNA polymerase beta' subunit
MNQKRKLSEEEIKDILSIIKVYRYLPNDIGVNICLNIRKNIENQLRDTIVYPEIIPKLKSIILDNYNRALLQPGEMVGTIAASSIGESTTQSSLNSVSWNSKTILYKKKSNEWNAEHVKIGEFIDNTMSNKPYKIVHYKGTNEVNTRNPYAHVYDVPRDEEYKIISVNENGKTSYERITQFIRHPLYTRLLKVITKSGRKIEATSGMSFLTKNKNKLVETLGSDLVVGDKIPILSDIKDDLTMIKKSVNLREWFSPKEYIYGAELYKAKEIRELYLKKQKEDDFTKGINRTTPRVRWLKHNDKDFILPHTKVHSFIYTIKSLDDITEDRKIRPDCIYMKVRATDVSHIPEDFPLDSLTGFFFGTYVSRGWADNRFIVLTYVNEEIHDMIKIFCKRYNITTNKCKENKIYIYNTILTKFCKLSCGGVTPNKRIPNFVYNAPISFIRGFFDGLFSNRLIINDTKNYILYKIRSRELVNNISLLLTRIGVFGIIRIIKEHNVIKYTISITNEQLKIFIKFLLSHKLPDPRTGLPGSGPGLEYIFNDNFNRYKRILINSDFDKKLQVFKEMDFDYYISQAFDKLDSIIFPSVYMDEIVSITDITNESDKYVYDFTVENTANFCSNGILMRDSFHTSGTNKANLTGGLVRQQELLNASKNVKTPSCTIYLKDIDTKDLFSVIEFSRSELIYNEISDIIDEYKIEYNPEISNFDKDIYNLFYKFYKNINFVYKDSTGPLVKNIDKVRIRLKFNKEKIYSIKKDLDYIASTISTALDINSDINGSGAGDSTFEIIFFPLEFCIIDIWIQPVLLDIDDVIKLIVKKNSSFTVSSMCRKIIDKFINDENIIEKYINNIVIPSVLKVPISGIFGIEECYYTDDKNGEWHIDTKGSNFKEIILHPNIDHTRTKSNNMYDILEVYGIEAANAFLFEEFSKNISVSKRHLFLLINSMTLAGNIMSVSRYGIDRRQVGPLAKACFEQPIDNFLFSATKGEKELLKGVTSNICMGKLNKMGTGMCDLILDINKIILSNSVNSQNKNLSLDTISGLNEEENLKEIKSEKQNEEIINIVKYEKGIIEDDEDEDLSFF